MKSADGSSARILPWPRLPARRGAELEFLPAALEIIETPASPAGRAIAATIILFFVAALAWATFGWVDIIATAPGKIVPTGRSKVVQPFETGVVRAIHVQDGQAVKAGDVLVELDPTSNAADEKRLGRDLVQDQLDVARLEGLLADDPAQFAPPETAPAGLVATAQRQMEAQAAEQAAKLASLDRQSAQKDAERREAEASIAKIEATLPLLRSQRDIREHLLQNEYGSRLLYLQAEQQVVEQEHELIVQRHKRDEIGEAQAAIGRQRAQAEAEYRKGVLADLAKAESQANGHREDAVKATQRRQLQTLTAPVDGTVQQLAVHTLGGVVTPAQALLVVVPAESHLEIEAMVPNRDIGFVHEGETAEIKVDTFNFTRYGLLHGKVLSVSQDAITRDRPRDKSGMAAQMTGDSDTSSEPKGQELVYAARVSLDRMQMQVEGRLVDLAPGMAVTVEIKTGSRRVIEYLLSPLLRYKQASFRER
jgi:hemolysin D